MNETRVKELQSLCRQFRKDLIEILYKIQTGHPGGSLSCTELVTTLYFEKMNHEPKNPHSESRDRFILSKGHAAPILYLVLAEAGYFPKEELQTLRQTGSNLQGHPCLHKTAGVELSTGPLGLGLGVGLGIALSNRIKGNQDAYVYVVLGDGEIEEGAIWEAAMAASKYQADHLIGILDNNGVQLDGTVDEIMPLGNIRQKWESFGWEVIECDGHDVVDVANAIDMAKESVGKPVLIQTRTVKGKGISFMEGKNIWHGKPISDEEYKAAMLELGGDL